MTVIPKIEFHSAQSWGWHEGQIKSVFHMVLRGLSSFAEEGGEEPVPILPFTPAGQLKAEVDKLTQVDIDKMLSVCAAHLIPPLSPQYK